jgi:hypothetical protein
LRNLGRRGGTFLTRFSVPSLLKKLWRNYPIGVEGGAAGPVPRLPPSEELLDVLGRDKPGVGLGGRVFGEPFEDVSVLLVGEGFAERLDVFEERFGGFFEEEGIRLLCPHRISQGRCLWRRVRGAFFFAPLRLPMGRHLRRREIACRSHVIR